MGIRSSEDLTGSIVQGVTLGQPAREFPGDENTEPSGLYEWDGGVPNGLYEDGVFYPDGDGDPIDVQSDDAWLMVR